MQAKLGKQTVFPFSTPIRWSAIPERLGGADRRGGGGDWVWETINKMEARYHSWNSVKIRYSSVGKEGFVFFFCCANRDLFIRDFDRET